MVVLIVGKINGSMLVGGISGDTRNGSTISYCYNNNDITGDCVIGGISGRGYIRATISNCYNKGIITANNSTSHETVAAGGIVAGLRDNGIIKYCYNLGTVICNIIYSSPNNQKTDQSGGICGVSIIRNSDNEQADLKKANRIQYCYNNANVLSKSAIVGGISGMSDKYCYLRNCKVSNSILVQGYRGVSASGGLGNADNYWIGKMAGRSLETPGSTYFGDNSLEITQTETVYYVVNSLNSGNSAYWSNSNVNEPKLKWE